MQLVQLRHIAAAAPAPRVPLLYFAPGRNMLYIFMFFVTD